MAPKSRGRQQVCDEQKLIRRTRLELLLYVLSCVARVRHPPGSTLTTLDELPKVRERG